MTELTTGNKVNIYIKDNKDKKSPALHRKCLLVIYIYTTLTILHMGEATSMNILHAIRIYFMFIFTHSENIHLQNPGLTRHTGNVTEIGALKNDDQHQ